MAQVTDDFIIINIIQVWSAESQGMKLNGFIGAVEDIEIWKLQSYCGRDKKMIRVRRCGAARGCCEELSTVSLQLKEIYPLSYSVDLILL